MMRRREFIAGIGGAAVWALAAGAQQAERTRRVGILSFGFQGPQSAPLPLPIRVLRDSLRSLGWIEDRNLQLDVRYTSDAKAVDAYADELVSSAPEVIVTISQLATRAVQQRTRSIPIVFAGVADPIEGGLVKSLARPEGNTTGITNLYESIGGKWVSLLRETVPSVAQVGIVISPGSKGAYVSEIEAAAVALHLQAIRIPYDTATELERAVDAFAAVSNGSLITHPPALVGINRQWFFRLVAKHGAAYDLPGKTLRPAGRPDVLWVGRCRIRIESGGLCGPHFARRKAGRSPGAVSDEIRVRDQSQDRQGARPHRAAIDSAARRRGHRIGRDFRNGS